MKLLDSFMEQLKKGDLTHVWLTSFNINIEFIEGYLLPAVLGMERPQNRLEFEYLQTELLQSGIDFRVFCDWRFIDADMNKRTSIPVHGVVPVLWDDWFSEGSLFHAKVIYLEYADGRKILGTGSANLTIDGWGRNQEVFGFFDVENKEQYSAIKLFFDRLVENVGIDERLHQRRGLPSGEGGWRFVHSHQDPMFLKQLFDKSRARDLLVWSPYLPKDLAAFINRLKASVASPDLRIHLVPDRIDGQHIRTKWNHALQTQVSDEVLTFYKNPVHPDPRSDLCHSKVWKLGGKLAIGSWNFTAKGSNLLDADGEWDTNSNVEAGVIVNEGGAWDNAVGKPIDMSPDNFASEQLLKEEELVVPPLPPFELRVTFDWCQQSYSFTGRWYKDKPQEGYAVRVPGLNEPIPLSWRPQKKDLVLEPRTLASPEILLNERRFHIVDDSKVVMSGLITETQLAYRRAQAFSSLNDLLDSHAMDSNPGSGDDVPFRIYSMHNTESMDSEFPEGTQIVQVAEQGEISFFRLFLALDRYGKRLVQANTLDEFNGWIFTRPGCLQELTEKTQMRITEGGNTIFNWFLVQEVASLCARAVKQRDRFPRREDPIPKSRWDDLYELVQKLKVDLPTDINKDYLNMIREECAYVSV